MTELTTEKLRHCIQSYVDEVDPSIKVLAGRMPDMPDRVTVIRRGSGRGTTVGGVFEVTSYIVESRGKQDSLDDAEYIANVIDDIILDKLNGLNCQDAYILIANWSDGGPQQQVINDPQSRYSFVCSYDIESGRDQ